MKKQILLFFIFLISSAAAQATPFQKAADSVLICQSRSAYAYHKYECRGLSRCTHGILKLTLEQAKKMGYKPCKICY